MDAIGDLFSFVLPALESLPALRGILGFILVFFLPGFAWTLVFFRRARINVVERIGLSFGLSIAIVTLSILALNKLIGVPVTGLHSVLVIIVVTIAALVIYYSIRLLRRRMGKDILSQASVSRNLDTRFVGQRVVYYPSLASTMAAAREDARLGAPEGTAIVAEEQTAGKGRQERAWLSPRGCIAMSVILRPELAYLPSLIMVASLAVVKCIKAVTGLEAEIKWPNDVLINGRKVGGILIENELKGNSVDYAVIGIGVNVNLNLAAFPDISGVATSLSGELGREISLLEVVRRLLVEIEAAYLALPGGGAVYEEWRDKLATLGKAVRVTAGDTVLEGVAESVDRDGGLMLRQQGGELTKIVAGDVTLRDV